MNEEQLNALQELMNIAMGRAGDRLARLVEHQVALSIPIIHSSVEILADSELFHVSQSENKGPVIARQSFLGTLRGEVMICFSANGANELAATMGYSSDSSSQSFNDELVLDITNILTGACIQGLAQQLDTTCTFGPPSLISIRKPLKEVLGYSRVEGNNTLFMELKFTISSHSFGCYLLICVSKESVRTLVASIEKLLADL